MRLSYFTPAEVKGTIEMNKPIHKLGNHEDIHGNIWNVNAVLGNVVCAVLKNQLHPYFNNTSTFNNYGLVQQTWEPYYVMVNGKYDNR